MRSQDTIEKIRSYLHRMHEDYESRFDEAHRAFGVCAQQYKSARVKEMTEANAGIDAVSRLLHYLLKLEKEIKDDEQKREVPPVPAIPSAPADDSNKS